MQVFCAGDIHPGSSSVVDRLRVYDSVVLCGRSPDGCVGRLSISHAAVRGLYKTIDLCIKGSVEEAEQPYGS